jgi:hypothetical protein
MVMARANPLRRLGCTDIVAVCACLVNCSEKRDATKRAGVFNTATSVASWCFCPFGKNSSLCTALQVSVSG